MIGLLNNLLLGSVELTLLFIAALAIERLAGGRWPRLAALVWIIVMLRALTTVFVAVPFSFPLPGIDAGQLVPTAVVSERIVGITGPAGESAEVVRQVGPASWTMPVALLWSTGALIMLVRLFRDHRSVRNLVRHSRAASPHTRAIAGLVGREIGLRALPGIRFSDQIGGPAVVGWVRPTILLPSWFEDDASETDLLWTLRHELMHVRTLDVTSGIVPSICRVLYWFHPLAWLAGRRWERLVERACDQAILASGSAVDYADTLYRLLVRVQARPVHSAGLFAVRSSIGQRIETLLRTDHSGARIGLLGTVGLLVISAPLFLFGAGWSGTPSYRVGHIEEIRDGVERTLDYRGAFELRGDGSVDSIDGGMTLEESGDRGSRHLQIEGDGQNIERAYRLDGRQTEYDEDARAWEASMLREIRE